MNSTQIQWQVQVRRSKAHKWVKKGTFETRQGARYDAACRRDGYITKKAGEVVHVQGVGFGNTRVSRYVKGPK